MSTTRTIRMLASFLGGVSLLLGAVLACQPDAPARTGVGAPAQASPSSPVSSPVTAHPVPESSAREPASSEGAFGTGSSTIDWAALPATSEELSVIAFGSCSSQYAAQPIWDIVRSKSPQLFLHLGDTVYSDRLPSGQTVPDDWDLVRKAQVDRAFWTADASFRAFAESIPMMLVWDDHDMGKNDGGRDFAQREAMEESFLDFIGARPSDPRRTRPGLYQARVFGKEGRRVQIILLDTRTFRSSLFVDERSPEEKKRLGIVGKYLPNDAEDADLLGDAQWTWLSRQLSKPAELRLIGSSIQVLADERGIESWGNYPREREKLFGMIAEAGAEGVVLLSGDIHDSELSRTDAGPYPLYDFSSSNLNQGEDRWLWNYDNQKRVAGPVGEENFGLIEVSWAEQETRVRLSAITQDGEAAYEYVLPLRDLRPPEREQ